MDRFRCDGFCFERWGGIVIVKFRFSFLRVVCFGEFFFLFGTRSSVFVYFFFLVIEDEEFICFVFF